MSNFVLSCSSTADLSNEYMRERDIPYACFHFEMDGVDYPDDMGLTMAPEDLFRHMAQGAETKTSQVTIGEYQDFFGKYLAEGRDILHICFSLLLTFLFILRSAVFSPPSRPAGRSEGLQQLQKHRK